MEPIFFAKSKSVRPALYFANFKNIKTAQMNHCFLRACKIYCQIEIYWICFTSELRNLWVLFLTSDLLENWPPVNGWFYEITAVCLNVCLPVCQLRVFLDNHSLVLFSIFFAWWQIIVKFKNWQGPFFWAQNGEKPGIFKFF